MFYRKILHQAWETTWKNKYLWFFGLFAALLGFNGSFEIVAKVFFPETETNAMAGFSVFAKNGIFNPEVVKNFFNLIFVDPLSFVILTAIFLIFLILGGFLFWLSIVSQAALISNSAKAATGKKHDFKDGLESGMKNFWPVLGLNIALKIIIFLGAALIITPLFLNVSGVGFIAVSLFFIFLFLLLVSVIFVLSLIIRYAVCFIVIKKSDWQVALKESAKLFRRNWLTSLEMTIIFSLVNLIVVFLMILTFLVLSVPIIFSILLMAEFNFLFGFWLVLALAAAFFLFFIVFVGAVLSTFQISGWTSFFVKLIGEGGNSKLIRFFGNKK